MNQAYGERVISDENSRAALWPVLTKIDADLAEQVWIEGCMHCGGALHRADYPRKARGVNVESRRHSFCCAREECRRRETPGSVRFLGRKVYAGFMALPESLVIFSGSKRVTGPSRLWKGRVGLPPDARPRSLGGVRRAFLTAEPLRCDSAALTRAQSLTFDRFRAAAATPSSRARS